MTTLQEYLWDFGFIATAIKYEQLEPEWPTHVPTIKENTQFHGDLYKNSHILFSRNQNDKEHTQVYLMSVHSAQYTFIWTLYYCIQHIQIYIYFLS